MRISHRYVVLSERTDLFAELDRRGIPCKIERRRFGDIVSVTGELFLYEDDPRFEDHRRALACFELGEPQVGTQVSREEKDAAEWHLLRTGQCAYPQPEDGWFEAVYGAEGTCETCGHHELQRAPFRFKAEPKAKHSQLMGLFWAYEPIFVREEAKSTFEAEGVTGVRFTRPVRHRSGAPLDSLWQLDVEVMLPAEGIRPHNLVVERCAPLPPGELAGGLLAGSRLATGPFCGRGEYNHPRRGLLTIEAAALAGAPDVVKSREHFGSGGCADRITLVSKKVRDLILRRRWRGAMLEPVALV